MLPAPHPHDEVERQRVLDALGVLDTPPDAVLDGLMRAAAHLTGCPISLVSLVDRDRQWFKARLGMDAHETPRDIAFCAHTIVNGSIFEVPDASSDIRFADNPLVTTDPQIRFYAGVPLAVQGRRIGALCVMDRQPRTLDDAQRALLHDLAAAVEHWMQGQRERHELQRVDAHRRAHERQLRLLWAAVEQCAEGIVIVDPEGSIEYANGAARASSGYPQDELIGRSAWLMLAGLSELGGRREMWSTLKSGRTWKGLLHYRRKDGSQGVEFATVTPIRDAQGQVAQYLVLKEDVTEKQRMGAELDQHRHRLEELVAQRTTELEQARTAAEAANRSKSAFLAAMSHEIRTPMNGVLGIVEVLRESPLTPYQTDLAGTIRDSALALLGIIDNILDFSKIEADHMALVEESIDIQAAAESVCDALQPLATSRGVALHAYVDPRLPARVICDGARMRQVLNNLLGNAIKFSSGLPQRGRVRLAVEPGPQGELQLQVSDNGIGMSEAVLQRIFQPFVQGETSTARRYGGTGLGLSISRRIVELAGGTIDVRSAPDEGATFTVRLPLRPDVDDAPTRLPISDPLDGVTCHFVLDDAQRAADWAGYLQAAGAQAHCWPDLTALRRALDASPTGNAVAVVEGELARALPRRADGPGLAAGLRAAIRIEPGQRRSARLLDPDTIALDGDALHRDNLVHAVAFACGRASPQPEAPVAAPSFGRADLPSIEDAARRHQLVLVAEDNEINRKVIQHQLALMGLACEVVDDGRVALERWRAGRSARRHGLLLTDLHMPSMDGHALTQAIRSDEAQDGKPASHLPIIALTANSLRGEAERCREAGMDDYLSKPVRLSELGEMLMRWMPSALRLDRRRPASQHPGEALPKAHATLGAPAAIAPGATDPRAGVATSTGTDTPDAEASPVLDAGALERTVGSMPSVLARIRRTFVDSTRASAAELRGAVQRGDAAGAGAIGHRLKSSSRSIGALRLGECCEGIETAGRTGNMGALPELLQHFETCLAQSIAAVEAQLTRDPPQAAAPATPTIGDSPSAHPSAHPSEHPSARPVGAPSGRATTTVAPPRQGASPNGMPPLRGVLLVDDEPVQLQLMRSQLATLGIAPVRACSSGAQALEALSQHDASELLLMVDLNMPGMDGVEFMRQLAESGYDGALALVSGADQRVLETASRLAEAHRLKVLSHLHKPVQPARLARLIGRWRGYTPEPAEAVERDYPARDIARGIAEGQMVLHYQPKVSLADGRWVGVEALVRWQHPTDGLLLPRAFIGVAEVHGIVDALTHTVLVQALAQARRWRDAGLELRVAVNISMDNLARVDFAEFVLDQAERAGVPPSDLVLEITESRLMRDVRAPMDVLTRLRLKRVGLSIDDFGTGHSSLAQLRDIPFDELKIDRGFVHGSRDNTTQRAILSASLGMAHQLGMKAVAEGVEDEADWDTVRDAGCDIAQGHHIAMPMPAEELAQWAARWRLRTRDVARA